METRFIHGHTQGPYVDHKTYIETRDENSRLRERIAELEAEVSNLKAIMRGDGGTEKVEQEICPRCNQEMGSPHYCRPDWSGPSIGGKVVSDE